MENEGAAATNPSLAEGEAAGEASAFAVLPMVAKYDAAAVQVIREILEIRDGVASVQSGAQAVAGAFHHSLDQLNGVQLSTSWRNIAGGCLWTTGW
eukprot:CAMPEP_0194069210 /NCGR_PEP_ID=MMETSP0009_2-20130614/87518_1 /TAXON_ID=210454 /ORGANISM="Grammatophora oceanica, Strain CCMP 410" /LENGTH=95 /DNA_ID=CAMNT_0038722381 /DNA_START=50 /DNA_END=334 /DNA_ORIENTATION=-